MSPIIDADGIRTAPDGSVWLYKFFEHFNGWETQRMVRQECIVDESYDPAVGLIWDTEAEDK